MGCGGSKPAVEATSLGDEYDNPVSAKHNVDKAVASAKFDIAKAEAKAVEAGPETQTFLASVLKAREKFATDAKIMEDACTRLQGLRMGLAPVPLHWCSWQVASRVPGSCEPIRWLCFDPRLRRPQPQVQGDHRDERRRSR